MALDKTQLELEFELTADSSRVKRAIKEQEKDAKKSTKTVNQDRVAQRRKQLADSIKQVRANARVEQQIIKKNLRLRLINERAFAKKSVAIQKQSQKELAKIRGVGAVKGGGGLLGGGVLGKAGAIAGIAFATKQIIQFGSSALRTSANLELFDRRAKIVFEDSLPKITAAAKESAAAIGLTAAEFTAAASATGDLLKPIGFTAEQAAESSIEFLNLAGALKEFNADSRSVSEISRIVTKSLLGERDALTSFGIKISEAEIKTKLLAKGQAKLTGQALILAKATATQTLLFEKSKDALTSFNEEGFKPLSRTLNEIDAGFGTATETLSVFIGRALRPLAEALVSGLNSFNMILESLSGLRDITATIVTMTSAVVALGIAFSTLGFGPIGLAIAAIAFGLGALAIAIDLVVDKNLTLGQQLKTQRVSIGKLVKTVDELQKVQNKTVEQTERLATAESQLRDEADKLNISLFNQKGELIGIAEAQQLVIDAQKKSLRVRIAATRAKLTPLEIQRGVISRTTGKEVKSFEKSLQTQIKNFETDIRALQGTAARNLQILFETTSAGRISTQRAILSQLEKDLAALDKPEPKVDLIRRGAPSRDAKSKAQAERFETIATFKFRQEQIEDQLQDELESINIRLEAELRAIKKKGMAEADQLEAFEKVRDKARAKGLRLKLNHSKNREPALKVQLPN